MDKEDVLCIYNEILLNRKKEWIWVSGSEVMKLEPAIQSEVSQKKKKEILHVNAHIWNLEKWYWWTYMQGRNGDADVENGLVDTARGGEGDEWRK